MKLSTIATATLALAVHAATSSFTSTSPSDDRSLTSTTESNRPSAAVYSAVQHQMKDCCIHKGRNGQCGVSPDCKKIAAAAAAPALASDSSTAGRVAVIAALVLAGSTDWKVWTAIILGAANLRAARAEAATIEHNVNGTSSTVLLATKSEAVVGTSASFHQKCGPFCVRFAADGSCVQTANGCSPGLHSGAERQLGEGGRLLGIVGFAMALVLGFMVLR